MFDERKSLFSNDSRRMQALNATRNANANYCNSEHTGSLFPILVHLLQYLRYYNTCTDLPALMPHTTICEKTRDGHDETQVNYNKTLRFRLI